MPPTRQNVSHNTRNTKARMKVNNQPTTAAQAKGWQGREGKGVGWGGCGRAAWTQGSGPAHSSPQKCQVPSLKVRVQNLFVFLSFPKMPVCFCSSSTCPVLVFFPSPVLSLHRERKEATTQETWEESPELSLRNLGNEDQGRGSFSCCSEGEGMRNG